MKLAYIYRDSGATWGIYGVVRMLGGKRMRMNRKGEGSALLADMCRNGNDYDLIVVNHEIFRELVVECPQHAPAVRESSTPIVIHEKTDGSQITFRQALLWPSVRLMLKRSVLNPPSLHNETEGRYHLSILHRAEVLPAKKGKAMFTPDLPEIILPKEALDKVEPFAQFAALAGIRNIAKDKRVDLVGHKEHPIFYAGTVQYSGSEIETHRKLCAQAVKKIPGGIGFAGRMLGISKYREHLRTSTAVVCPWGWGETSYREYEAWLSGAVVIKPPMEHVRVFPGAMFDLSWRCAPNFSNVAEVLAKIQDDSDLPYKRKAAHEAAATAGSTVVLKDRFVQLVEEKVLCRTQ